MPRFDQSFNGICEQNLQDTLQLKQRYLDQKTKRSVKPKDKKHQDSIQSSIHVQQKFLKRPAEEHDAGSGGGTSDNFEPPVKLHCGSHQETKFSVEIVQQLEFTTSTANSQPQQISTNVTVKAHTNTSVKSGISSPKSATSGASKSVEISNLVELVKQEPINDFADLEECAAAVEKDGGMGFGGITDFIGDDTNDEIFTSPAFKDLISDISNYPEFNFDFEGKTEMKIEEPQMTADVKNINLHNPQIQNALFDVKRPQYQNIDFQKNELSPAAHTLKQMAEQHQHKLSYNPNNARGRSPYQDYHLNDYNSSPNNTTYHKPFPSQTNDIKQELGVFQTGSDYDIKRKQGGIYKQYSPYGSPSPGSHGSPGYLPLPRSNQCNNNNGGSGQGGSGQGGGGFGGSGTPPRPNSGHGGGASAAGVGGTTLLQMNQSQTVNINQMGAGGHGHNIQVSAGQNVNLSGDIKGNVSIGAQQGLHFKHQTNAQPSNSQSMPTQQQQPTQQQPQQQQQQPQQATNQSPASHDNPHQSTGNISAGVPNNLSASGMGVPVINLAGNGGLPNINSMMNPSHNQTQMGGDSYSITQSQTINFTQQSLRQRTNGGPNSMVGGTVNIGGQMGPSMAPSTIRHMHPIEHQKILQQQQLLRAQQQQQQQQQQHMVRPPPPDYKTTASMIQGMGPRYAGGPQVPQAANMRRMPHQAMPPSGPMMRPHNVYMVQQQQHMSVRGGGVGMYPRPPHQQQGGHGMDSGMPPQHGSPSEWRHVALAHQHQNQANYNAQVRPNYQHQGGMTAMQQQQSIRSQQQQHGGGGMPPGGQILGQHGGPPMSQMSSINQQILIQQHQSMQHSQMPMSNINMQQSQCLTINNQPMHPQQQQPNNQQLSAATSSNQQQQQQSNSLSNQSNELFDILGIQPDSVLSEQDLLNTFASDSGFNLNDISF